jgi:hypothetical protein
LLPRQVAVWLSGGDLDGSAAVNRFRWNGHRRVAKSRRAIESWLLTKIAIKREGYWNLLFRVSLELVIQNEHFFRSFSFYKKRKIFYLNIFSRKNHLFQ